jgi:hypothetical protein
MDHLQELQVTDAMLDRMNEASYDQDLFPRENIELND